MKAQQSKPNLLQQSPATTPALLQVTAQLHQPRSQPCIFLTPSNHQQLLSYPKSTTDSCFPSKDRILPLPGSLTKSKIFILLSTLFPKQHLESGLITLQWKLKDTADNFYQISAKTKTCFDQYLSFIRKKTQQKLILYFKQLRMVT